MVLFDKFADFTPSRGNTPVHASGTPRLSRVFSPQVSRAVFEGKPPMRSGKFGKFVDVSSLFVCLYVIV